MRQELQDLDVSKTQDNDHIRDMQNMLGAKAICQGSPEEF